MRLLVAEKGLARWDCTVLTAGDASPPPGAEATRMSLLAQALLPTPLILPVAMRTRRQSFWGSRTLPQCFHENPLNEMGVVDLLPPLDSKGCSDLIVKVSIR